MSQFRQLQRQIFLISAPVLIVIFSLLTIFFLYSTGIIGSKPLPMLQLPSLSLPQIDLTQIGVNKIDIAKFENLKDPFEIIQTTDTATEKLEEIVLNMVIFSQKDAFCKVNGKFYRNGESGPGYTILKIDETGVWFTTGDTTFFLAPGQKRIISASQHNEQKRRVL